MLIVDKQKVSKNHKPVSKVPCSPLQTFWLVATLKEIAKKAMPLITRI